MVVKGGYVVDPRCDVAETTHVYVDPITSLFYYFILNLPFLKNILGKLICLLLT